MCIQIIQRTLNNSTIRKRTSRLKTGAKELSRHLLKEYPPTDKHRNRCTTLVILKLWVHEIPLHNYEQGYNWKPWQRPMPVRMWSNWKSSWLVGKQPLWKSGRFLRWYFSNWYLPTKMGNLHLHKSLHMNVCGDLIPNHGGSQVLLQWVTGKTNWERSIQRDVFQQWKEMSHQDPERHGWSINACC